MRLPGRKQDYWQMSDANLEALADKYNIQQYLTNGGHTHIDRKVVIDQMVQRDTALNTKISWYSMIISIIAAIVSVASAIYKVFSS
jgi:hypothetical protein